MITRNDKRLAKNIRKNRRKLKLTQEKLANQVGVSPKYIQYIESLKRTPSIKLVYRIAKALKISPAELLK